MATRKNKKAPNRGQSKADGAERKAYIPLTDLVQGLPVEIRSLAMSALSDVLLAVHAGDTKTLEAIREAARTVRLATESSYLAVQTLCENYLASEGPCITRGERPSLRELCAADLARQVSDLGVGRLAPAAILEEAHVAKDGRDLAVRIMVRTGYTREKTESAGAFAKRIKQGMADAASREAKRQLRRRGVQI